MLMDWKIQHSKYFNFLQNDNGLNTFPTEMQAWLAMDINKITLKYSWEGKQTKIAITLFRKQKIMSQGCLPDFKTYYIVNNQGGMLLAGGQTHRSIVQKKEPETDSYNYV